MGVINLDIRNNLIDSIGECLLHYIAPEDLQIITNNIIKILNDYEISERCTDVIIPVDKNTRIIKRYMACLSIDGKSEKTIEQYYRTIRKILDFLGKDITDIGVYDIRYFLACEKERGISNRTLENTRANLSAFFQWLAQEELIVKNPCMNIKPIKYKDEIRLPFSLVEIDNLRYACNTLKERAMIEFLLSSGVRVSELTSIRIQDIDFNTLAVHVVHGKGNKERITYINDVAKQHIEKYLLSRDDNLDVLFCNRNKSQLLPNGVRYILNEIGKRAGVENVHPHRFRRTFASNLAKRGMKIEEIKLLMGHVDINTTMKYIYVDNENVVSSYKKFIA